MKKLLLFPYHPDVELLAEKTEELEDVSVVGVCSFREDAAAADAVNQRLGCTGSFTELLEKCDTLLLLDDYRESKKEKYYEVIQSASDAGKQIMITPIMAKQLNLSEYQGQYTILQTIPKNDLVKGKKEIRQARKKYTIETPIIVVFGMGQNCCKFENQILLKSILDKEGYKAGWISSNPLGALFGGYTMPEFLYDRQLAFEEKVIRFNQFVYQLSIAEKPDVFVIGIPEGISEFSTHEYNHFAEYPLVIGSAVSVDSAVLCTYFMPKLDLEGMKEISLHCRERFGFPVHAASIGRTAFEKKSENKRMAYLFLEEEYLQKHYETLPDQPEVYAGVWETEKMTKAIHIILNRLQGNPDAI